MIRILRRIVDRRQDFRSTEDYPHGWIEETLECGHVHIEGIFPEMPAVIDGRPVQHSHNASRRRCEECGKAARKAGAA